MAEAPTVQGRPRLDTDVFKLTPAQVRAGIDPHARTQEEVDVTKQFGKEKKKRSEAEDRAQSSAYVMSLQRNTVKREVGKAKSPEQDAALKSLSKELGRDLTYPLLFEEMRANEDLAANPLVQNISAIEIEKRFGYSLDPREAPGMYHKLKSSDEALQKQLKITPQEGQGTLRYQATYVDSTGKAHTVDMVRVAPGDEGDIQRRKRKVAATLKAGTAEGTLLGIDLGDDLLNAFLDKRTDQVNIPLYRTSSGDHAFDVATARTRLTDFYYHTKLSEAGHTSNAPLAPDARRAIFDAAAKKAETEMSAIMQKGTGVFFVDRDPEGKTEEIINNPFGIRDWHPMAWIPGVGDAWVRAISPIRATMAGVQPMDAYYSQMRTTLEDQGLLEYLGNLALSTSVGSAIHAGGWGTPEHIRLIRRGYDLTDDYGNIAQILTPKGLEETWMTHVPGVAAMIGLLLVDPDPTLLLGPAGKGGKAVMKGLGLSTAAMQATRLGTQQKLLRELLEMSPEHIQKVGYKEWAQRVSKADQDLYHNFTQQLKAREAVKVSSDERLIHRKYQNKIDKMEAGLKLARKQLDEAKAQRTGTKKSAEESRLEIEAAEREMKIDQTRVVQAQDVLMESYSVLPTILRAEDVPWHLSPKGLGENPWLEIAARTDLSPQQKLAEQNKLMSRLNRDAASRAGKLPRLEKELAWYKKFRLSLEAQQKKLVESNLERGGGYETSMSAARRSGSKTGIVYFQQKLGKAVNKVSEILGNMPEADFLSMMKDGRKFEGLPKELQGALRGMFNNTDEAFKYLVLRKRMINGKDLIVKRSAQVMKAHVAKDHMDAVQAASDAAFGLLERAKARGMKESEYSALLRELRSQGLNVAARGSNVSDMVLRVTKAQGAMGRAIHGLADEYVRSIDLVTGRLMSVSRRSSKINPLRVKGVLTKAADGLKLNSPLLLEKVREKYGTEIVDRFFEEIGGKTTAATNKFREMLEGPPITLGPDEVRILNKGLGELELRSTQLLPKAEHMGQSLLNDIKSIHRTGVATRDFRRLFNEDHKFKSWLFDLQGEMAKMGWKLQSFVKGVTHTEAAAGMNARILEAYQRAIEVSSAVNQELAFLTRGLRDSELRRVLSEYLNGTKSMTVKGGNFVGTIMNVGPVSMAHIAFNQILSDPAVMKYVDNLLNKVPDNAELATIESIPKTLQSLSRVLFPPGTKINTDDAVKMARKTVEIIARQMLKDTGPEIDLVKFMSEMQKEGAALLETYKAEPIDKAWHWLSQSINSGVMMDASARVATNVFGSMDDKTADIINKVIGGKFAGQEGLANYSSKEVGEAFGKLAEWGLPTLSRQIKDGGVELSNQLVKVSQDANGMGAFVPQALVEKINGTLKGIIKDLEVQSSKNPSGPMLIAQSLMSTLFGLFRASITTGLFLPNPRYWLNNVVGDFSQIWKEEDFGTAMKLSFQNLPTNLPFIGRPLHNHMMKMSEWSEGKPLLSSAINALMNPALNKVWNGAAEDIITMKNGVPYVVGDVRRMMAEDGILDTFVQATLLDSLRKEHQDQWRLIPKAWKEALEKNGKGVLARGEQKLEDINEAIQQHATFVQQRQRAGLYMEVINRGGSRAEAKEAVMNALYNWKAPMSQREMTYLTKMFTFYRFQKLATQQFVRNIVLAMRGERQGARAISRLRQMEQGLDVIPAAAYHSEGRGEEGQAKTFEEAMDAMYRDIPFWWQGARPVAYSTPITNAAVQAWYKERGFEYTYQDILMPPFTPLDMANQWIGMSAALMSVMHPAIPGEGVPTTDVTSKLLVEPLTAAMSPGLSTAVELALKSFMGGTQYVGGGRSYLRPGEDEFFPLMGMEGLIKRDDSDRAYVEGNGRSFLMLYRSTPFLGTQASQYYTAADNPYWRSSNAEGMTYFLTKLLGVAPRPKDPERELSFSVKERKAEIEKLVRSAEGRLAQQEFKRRNK